MPLKILAWLIYLTGYAFVALVSLTDRHPLVSFRGLSYCTAAFVLLTTLGFTFCQWRDHKIHHRNGGQLATFHFQMILAIVFSIAFMFVLWTTALNQRIHRKELQLEALQRPVVLASPPPLIFRGRT